MKKRILTLAMALIMIIGTAFAAEGFAASVGVSMTGASCQVGQNVSVTVTYSGSYPALARFTLSYDTGLLELVGTSLYGGGGSYLMESQNSAANAISGTFTFRAKAAGSARVSISTMEGLTWNEEEFGGSTSSTITISAPSSGGGSTSSGGGGSKPSKPSSNTNGRGDFTESSLDEPEEQVEEETVDPSEKPEQIEVTVGEKTYIIVESLKDKDLPEGFEAKDSKYGEYEWKIQVAKSENSEYTLILLRDKESDEESWFLYNEETGEITSSTNLDVMQTLEYERLLLEEEARKNDNTVTLLIILSAVLGAGLIGTVGYMVYTKKSKQLIE